MRILVYGAGVLGCNLARDFFRAGKDVTLLARGEWAKTIQTNGLCIQNWVFRVKSTIRVPVVTELAPDDRYDVIFVATRYTCINRREFAICTDFFRHFAGDFLPPCRDSLPPRQFS